MVFYSIHIFVRTFGFAGKVITKIVNISADINAQKLFGSYFSDKTGCLNNNVYCVTPYKYLSG